LVVVVAIAIAVVVAVAVAVAFLFVILREAEDMLLPYCAYQTKRVISTEAVRASANCGAEKSASLPLLHPSP
jgi:hypothetical protein